MAVLDLATIITLAIEVKNLHIYFVVSVILHLDAIYLSFVYLFMYIYIYIFMCISLFRYIIFTRARKRAG